LKVSDWLSVIRHCSKVLEHDPTSIKAYFRRAQALAARHAYEEALGDLQRARALALDDDKAAAAGLSDTECIFS
jgi:tetratricopeptide (TPR) repeat protein